MWARSFQNKADREAQHAATFKKLDTDHSGKLSLTEAKAGADSWAKANHIKMTKEDVRKLEEIFFNHAGPKGELNFEQYVEYNEAVNEKMNRLFWKDELHSIWTAASGGDGHVTWPDAKMELEAWASENGIRIKSDNLAKGDLLD